MYFILQSVSTRFLTTFWWIFCLVILFLYFISLRATLFPATSFDRQNNQQTHQSDDRQQNLMHAKRLTDFLNDRNTRLGVIHESAIQHMLEVKNLGKFHIMKSIMIHWLTSRKNKSWITLYISLNHKSHRPRTCTKNYEWR